MIKRLRLVCVLIVISSQSTTAGTITQEQCTAIKDGLQAALIHAHKMTNLTERTLTGALQLLIETYNVDATKSAEMSKKLREKIVGNEFNDLAEYSKTVNSATLALRQACSF